MPAPNPHRLFTPEGGDADPVFQIGLRTLPVERWFEGGEADPAARKRPILQAHRTLAWGETEGSLPAQAEAAAMIAAWIGAAILPGEPPLLAASLIVPDDLCLMERREGRWTLTAASLCAPSLFSAEEAVGRDLRALHGPVPGFGQGFLPRVVRMFDNLPADTVVERRNWSITHSPELFTPSAEEVRADLPALSVEALSTRLLVRRERQTIRRLPRTLAALFTIRVWLEPVSDIRADRREALAAAWERAMGEEGRDFRAYKRLDLYDAAMRRLLSP